MDTVETEALTEAIRTRRHVIVRARLPADLRLPRGFVGLRARCDGDGRPLGPLRDVAVRALTLLGEDRAAASLREQTSGRRRRALFEPEESPVVAIVRALNALASRARGPAAIILDEVGAADDATLDVLTQLVSMPGVLRLSLVLACGEPPRPAVRALMQAVLEGGGVDATTPFERDEAPMSTEDGAWRQAMRHLPPEAILTLRAAATAGESFDVDAVAALREIPALRVLEHLQVAREMGFALDDTGEGRIRMPANVAATLRQSVLPSLARRWHLDLAARHARPSQEPAPSAPAAPASAPVESAPRDAEPSTRAPHRVVEVKLPPVPITPSPDAVFAPTPATKTPASTPPSRHASVPLPTAVASSQDGVRAASHLAAAGDLEGAARQLCSAVHESAALGLPVQALELARRALALLDGLPDSASRRALRAELLLAMGTIQWRATGPGDDFALPAAIATLREARAALPATGAADLRAKVAGAIAGACGEVGDIPSLDAALEELTEATRSLREAGAVVEAARLLNDQAAIHLRLGDPVKAAWLLQQSREVFAERAASLSSADPSRRSVLMELAETDHLFARLPLHARARPGREADALTLGREHAEAALSLFEELGESRDAARVRETLGRIELRAGHPRRAEEHLLAALATEETLGDVLGLARVTTALAELHATEGRAAEALARVSDAVTFNLEKGSALGIAYTRRTLERVRALTSAEDPSVRERLAAVEAQLDAAEGIVGRAELTS